MARRTSTGPLPPVVTIADAESSLTLLDAAAKLHLSRSTLKREIAAGRLKTYRVGTGRGTIRITERALVEYVNLREAG